MTASSPVCERTNAGELLEYQSVRSASLATSDSEASAMASVAARRWRAIFMARTTSGGGGPGVGRGVPGGARAGGAGGAGARPDHRGALVEAPEPRQRLLRRGGGDL